MKKDLANFLSLSVPALRRAAFFSLLAFLVLYSPAAPAQTDTVLVPRDRILDLWNDFTMKSVWVMYADVQGMQVGGTIQIEDDPITNTSVKGERGVFKGCIFDYSRIPPTNNGGAINILIQNFKWTFKNYYWKNCTNPCYQYYSRAVSFPFDIPGLHTNSIMFENFTFVNIGCVY
jgi:hypothetical protein